MIVQNYDNEIDKFGDHVGVLYDYHAGVAVNVVVIRQDDNEINGDNAGLTRRPATGIIDL